MAHVCVFVSSTWLDLQPERKAVEEVLHRFADTKFVGMEYFGSRDETTRQASLDEVDKSDVYVGIIGARYGSGITEAEYQRARDRGLHCAVYFKRDQALPDPREPAAAIDPQLARFKAALRQAHTISEFTGPWELASRVASDLHNWLFDHHLAPALRNAARGDLPPAQAAALNDDLRHLVAVNRDLVDQVAAEQRRLDQQRRLALQAFYQLTYFVPEQLARHPGTEPVQVAVAKENLRLLEELLALDPAARDVQRELATNHRLLGGLLLEAGDATGAHAAYVASGTHCATLVAQEPGSALYHRDRAASLHNAGYCLERMGDEPAALAQYELAVTSARRAAELDSLFAPDAAQAEGAAARLRR